jgi:hypothetical protein
MILQNKVCLHCGGVLVVRYGDTYAHARSVRGAPVCKRTPEPVTRLEYEARMPVPDGITDSEGGEPA